VKADLTVVVAELCSAWMQSHLGECKMLEVRPMLNELESDFHDPPNRTILRFTIEGDDELGVRLRFRADVLQQLQALNPFLLHALHSTLEAAAYRIIPIHTPATVLDLWSYTHWCGASTNAEFVKEQRDMGDDVEESDIGPDDGPDGYCKAFDRFEGMAKSDERAWISREKPKSQERLVARLRRLAKQATPHLRRVIEAVIDVQSMIGTCQPLASLGVRMEDCDEFAERAATVWPPGDDDHEPQVQAMYRAVDDAYHYLYEGGGIGPYSGFDFEQGSTTELTEFFTEYEKTFAAVKAVDALLALVTTTE
jgi:PRTRC genetic system protein F